MGGGIIANTYRYSEIFLNLIHTTNRLSRWDVADGGALIERYRLAKERLAICAWSVQMNDMYLLWVLIVRAGTISCEQLGCSLKCCGNYGTA